MSSPPSEPAEVGDALSDSERTGSAETSADAESVWVARQVHAMAASWSRGEPVTAEDLLAHAPGLGDEAAIRLIYEEVCLRRDSGQEIATAEVVSRFPRWKDELEVLLGCDRMLRPFSRAAGFPEPGEDLGPFRLLSELGRGASGRTYLVAETALAGRLVVLKLLSDDQEEHLSLARLQHTHIIPLYSEQTFPERGLRALCMPYLGGTSLARILEAVTAIPPDARRGRHILEALDTLQARDPAPWNSDGPYRRYLEQASYVHAVCWIGACLADALQSAHAHGLVHLDVKPSNALIAADGLPLLLDFHLARRPIRQGEHVTDRLGGTQGWMAPEHRAAFEATIAGRTIAEAVDARADLYALGLLLADALGGSGAAQDASAGRPWRHRNCDVSVGLAEIVQKCVAAKPALRYENPALLADDLRRELNDLPLRGVPNRSLSERWRKWRRRRPAAVLRVAAWLVTAAALVALVVLAQVFYLRRTVDIREIETALADGKSLLSAGKYPESAQTITRGLERAGSVLGVGPLYGALAEQLRRARRGQKATALHDLAELARFRYGVELPAEEEARALLREIRAVWDGRGALLSQAGGALGATTEQAIRSDLLDLAILWSELRIRLAGAGESEPARADALLILTEAADACGPSTRLDRLRCDIAGANTERGDAGILARSPVSALDHLDAGRAYLRNGAFREAAQEFERVRDERPGDFWPNFYRGVCAYRLGQFQDAVAAFDTCTALLPYSAQCYYNRALAYDSLGRHEPAVRDYGRALQLDPGLARAALNRGIIAYKDRRYDGAIADFRRALRAVADSRAIGRIHYNLALAYAARGDQVDALASTELAILHGCDEARGLRDRLRGRP
jgi:serine/threonine protein kinase/tetratricopeptide (TPR) repeat protein